MKPAWCIAAFKRGDDIFNRETLNNSLLRMVESGSTLSKELRLCRSFIKLTTCLA